MHDGVQPAGALGRPLSAELIYVFTANPTWSPVVVVTHLRPRSRPAPRCFASRPGGAELLGECDGEGEPLPCAGVATLVTCAGEILREHDAARTEVAGVAATHDDLHCTGEVDNELPSRGIVPVDVIFRRAVAECQACHRKERRGVEPAVTRRLMQRWRMDSATYLPHAVRSVQSQRVGPCATRPPIGRRLIAEACRRFHLRKRKETTDGSPVMRSPADYRRSG
jgi:hypothetical protein